MAGLSPVTDQIDRDLFDMTYDMKPTVSASGRITRVTSNPTLNPTPKLEAVLAAARTAPAGQPGAVTAMLDGEDAAGFEGRLAAVEAEQARQAEALGRLLAESERVDQVEAPE